MRELFEDNKKSVAEYRISLFNEYCGLSAQIIHTEADHIKAERMARVMASADAEDPDVTVAPHRVMQLTKRGNTVIPDNCVKLWQTYLGLAYALIDDERLQLQGKSPWIKEP